MTNKEICDKAYDVIAKFVEQKIENATENEPTYNWFRFELDKDGNIDTYESVNPDEVSGSVFDGHSMVLFKYHDDFYVEEDSPLAGYDWDIAAASVLCGEAEKFGFASFERYLEDVTSNFFKAEK